MAGFDEATDLLRQMLGLNRRLYPRTAIRRATPDLAHSLNNLGLVLGARGDLARAEPFYRDALAMYRQLYPRGHPDLANSLNNLGPAQVRGESGGGRAVLPRGPGHAPTALPEERYPQGHPHLATSLNNLGGLLQARGEYAAAEPFYRDALAMHRQLYPEERYPAGPPRPGHSLNNLGSLLETRGELRRRPSRSIRDALAMRQAVPAERYPRDTPTWPPA